MKFSFNILIMIFLGIRLLHAGDCLAPVFRDDVFDQMAPEMTREDIRPENMERLFKMYAPIYGGKGFWMKVLELLSQDEGAGFSVPKSDYYTVSRMWHRFFKANQSNIETANEIASQYSGRERTSRIEKIIYDICFSQDMDIQEYDYRTIARSSGADEDSFDQNLAGIFTSVKTAENRDLREAVRKIIFDYLHTIWIDQYHEHPGGMKDVPKQVTLENGLGIVVQEFCNFEASGTAVSDYYGYTTIEAAFGEAEVAVKGKGDSLAVYTFKNSDPEEYTEETTYENMPYEFRLGTHFMRESRSGRHMLHKLQSQNYPVKNGKFYPLSREQAEGLFRAIRHIRQETGMRLDLEWGYENGELRMTQARPLIGDFSRDLCVESDALRKMGQPAAKTPIALGETPPEGFTGKIVLFGNNATLQDIEAFEQAPSTGPYIGVNSDALSKIALMEGTKQKVVVDTNVCSRQAHKIQLVSERIGRDFVYANSPVLRQGLLANIEFVPHPVIRGVWVSTHEVTYFSNGLSSKFYTEKAAPSEPRGNADRFNKRLSALLSGKETAKAGDHDVIMELVCLIDPEMTKYKGLLTSAMKIGDEPIQDHLDLFTELQIPETKEKIDNMLHVLELYLSNPLFPHLTSGNKWMQLFKNVLSLKAIERTVSHHKRTVRYSPDKKVRILLLDDDHDNVEMNYLALGLNLDLTNIEIVTAESYAEAIRIVQAKPVDIVYMDITIFDTGNMKPFDALLDSVPVVITCSGLQEDEQKERLHKRFQGSSLPEETVYTVKPIDLDELYSLIRSKVEQVLSEKKKSISHEKKKMKVLVIKGMEEKIPGFHRELDDRYFSVTYAWDYQTAIERFGHEGDMNFDCVLVDLPEGKGGDGEGAFYQMISDVPFIFIATDQPEEEVLTGLGRHMTPERVALLKEERELQVKQRGIWTETRQVQALKDTYRVFTRKGLEPHPSGEKKKAVFTLIYPHGLSRGIAEGLETLRLGCPVVNFSTSTELKDALDEYEPVLVILDEAIYARMDFPALNPSTGIILLSGNPRKAGEKYEQAGLSVTYPTLNAAAILQLAHHFFSRETQPAAPEGRDRTAEAA